MSKLLIKGAAVVATMDKDRHEIPNCDILVENGTIAAVSPDLRDVDADETIRAENCVVLPGLVNTHNHSFQALYRALPGTQQVHFVEWIQYLTSVWLNRPFSPEAVHAAARANFAELLLTGTTTTADQHYPYPAGQPTNFVERTVDAAREVGIRIHVGRGCVTMGRSRGGLVPDELSQPESVVLEDAARLIELLHDPKPLAMVRLVLAPLGLYSDSEHVYHEMAELATQYAGVGLHTHLHEVVDEQYCREKYGVRPLEVLERAGWLTPRALFYHVAAPHFSEKEIARIADSHASVSHCPVSDMRVGYGLAQIREFLDAGVNVSFGTTGPASSSGADLLIEMKTAMLVHRLRFDVPSRWLSARDILWMGTRGGAAALGRDDLGSIEPGNAADLAIFDLGRLDMAGQHDPIAALLLQGSCHFTKATVVSGRVVAQGGHLLSADEGIITRDANAWARRLVEG